MMERSRTSLDRRWRFAVPICAAMALAVLSACDDLLVEGRGVSLEGTGIVEGVVRLDADGNGILGAQDPPFPGLRVRLLSAGNGGVVDTATTNEQGLFRMLQVPIGEFRLSVDSTTLPDSVQLIGFDGSPFPLGAGQTVQAGFGVNFPEFGVAEVRALSPGQRVFTRGIVLNQRTPPGNDVVHIREGDAYLRLTSVAPVALAIGDSVRVRGRTSTSGGQPVLEDVTIFRLVQQAAFVAPVELSSAAAATAQGGALDAALVRIRDAVILDTISVGGDLRVTANDGSGPVVLFLREFINFNRAQLVPGETLFQQATGLLVPEPDGLGGTRWRLTPRAPADLTVALIPPPPPAAALAPNPVP